MATATSIAQTDVNASGHKSSSLDGRKTIAASAIPDPRTALNGVLNLDGGVYHDKTVQQLPPVYHEFVQPTQHTIVHEHITREVHTHDVFHRILPIIDVVTLPTKHYLADPKNPGVLKEIPSHEAPSRNNWSINHHIQTDPKQAIATNGLSLHQLSKLAHRAHESSAPVLSSQKSYMTKEGHMKHEYIWRHPPTLDWSAYDRGETVPLRMNCMDEGKFSDVLIGQPNHARATADKGLSATHGTYGHGVEVPALQSAAYSALHQNHDVLYKPSAGLENLDRQRAVPHDTAQAGTSSYSQSHAVPHSPLTGHAPHQPIGSQDTNVAPSTSHGQTHEPASNIGTGGAGKFEGGVGTDYAQPGTTLGDHLHGSRNRGLDGGADGSVPLTGVGVIHDKHNRLHKEPPATHPGSTIFAQANTTRDAYDEDALNRNAANASAYLDRAARHEETLDATTSRMQNTQFGKIV